MAEAAFTRLESFDAVILKYLHGLSYSRIEPSRNWA